MSDMLDPHDERGRPSRAFLAIDLRPYRHRVGEFFIADRVLLRGSWTPLVRVRVRHSRAADGSTEI